jgi:ankyrin repeat protein
MEAVAAEKSGFLDHILVNFQGDIDAVLRQLVSSTLSGDNLKILKQHGASLVASRALHVMCQSGYTATLKHSLFLWRNEVDLDAKVLVDSYHVTALYLAASEGHTAVVKLLIDAGANVLEGLIDGNDKSFPPLFVAAEGGKLAVFEVLRGFYDEEVVERALQNAATRGHGGLVKKYVTKETANGVLTGVLRADILSVSTLRRVLR